MRISGNQIAAARELLGLTQTELAEAAGVSYMTIANFETGKHEPYQSTVEKIRGELERRGIEFTNGDSPSSGGQGMGVRLKFEKAAEFARSSAQPRKEPAR